MAFKCHQGRASVTSKETLHGYAGLPLDINLGRTRWFES